MKSALALLCLFVVVQAKSPASRVPPMTRVLELQFDTVADNADPAVVKKTLGAFLDAEKKREGCDRNDATWLPDSRRILRATIWTKREDAEAASLARDGGDATKAWDKLCDRRQRSVMHMRVVREMEHEQKDGGYLEVVVFRTKPGVTREQNEKLFAATIEPFQKVEGLLAHGLWLAPDGRWVHLLHWREGADYTKGGKAAMGMAPIRNWIRSLDFKRFEVFKGDTLKR